MVILYEEEGRSMWKWPHCFVVCRIFVFEHFKCLFIGLVPWRCPGSLEICVHPAAPTVPRFGRLSGNPVRAESWCGATLDSRHPMLLLGETACWVRHPQAVLTRRGFLTLFVYASIRLQVLVGRSLLYRQHHYKYQLYSYWTRILTSAWQNHCCLLDASCLLKFFETELFQ